MLLYTFDGFFQELLVSTLIFQCYNIDFRIDSELLLSLLVGFHQIVNACIKHFHIEWFRQVSVCSCIETSHLVFH